LSGGSGGRKRRDPDAGRANGNPRNASTEPSRAPRSLPRASSTTRSPAGAPFSAVGAEPKRYVPTREGGTSATPPKSTGIRALLLVGHPCRCEPAIEYTATAPTRIVSGPFVCMACWIEVREREPDSCLTRGRVLASNPNHKCRVPSGRRPQRHGRER
jgi:hypothetical protein